MPKPKWETFKETKEYKMWSNIQKVLEEYNLSGNDYVTRKDIGGKFWEPLYDRIFKLGVTLKHAPKTMKGIKSDWMRPLLYLESQSQEKVIFDNDTYIINKGALANATNLRFAFKRLLDSLCKANSLDENNFAKEYKQLKEDSKYFFKMLNNYIKLGYRDMHENLKQILLPLRLLRKSAYRLFSIEQQESGNVDLNIFKDKNSLKQLTDSIKEGLKWDEFILKRDVNVDLLNQFLDKDINPNLLEYHFTNKIIEKEKLEQDPYESMAMKINEIQKKDSNINNNDGNINQSNSKKKGLTPEQKLKIQQMKELHKLVYPNIKDLTQKEPTKLIHEALQLDFEKGLYAMIEYLNRKMPSQIPILINTHKLFVNINKCPNGRTNIATLYYIKQMDQALFDLKVKCYEMKLNGLSRILIPITENVEFINLVKQVYDLHRIINNIMGDYLKYEQFTFFYDKLKYVNDSNLKDDFLTIKSKNFIENGIEKYLVFATMCEGAKSLNKIYDYCKKNKIEFKKEDYFQLSKLNFDTKNNFNSEKYYYFEKDPNLNNKQIIENKKILDKELQKFGRIFLLENFFPQKEKDNWFEAIDILSTITELVQEDIRDNILYNSSSLLENEKKIQITNVGTSKSNSRNSSRQVSRKGSRKNSRATSPMRKVNSKNKLKETSKKKKNIQRKSTSESNKTEESVEKNQLLNAKLDQLRPPFVWNFPVKKIEQIKKENEEKKLNKKKINENIASIQFNQIRKVDPKVNYHDGRVEKFLELFNNIFQKMIEYCKKERNDNWDYLLDKVFEVFGMKYAAFYDKFQNVVDMSYEEKKEQDDNNEMTGLEKDNSNNENIENENVNNENLENENLNNENLENENLNNNDMKEEKDENDNGNNNIES